MGEKNVPDYGWRHSYYRAVHPEGWAALFYVDIDDRGADMGQKFFRLTFDNDF